MAHLSSLVVVAVGLLAIFSQLGVSDCTSSKQKRCVSRRPSCDTTVTRECCGRECGTECRTENRSETIVCCVPDSCASQSRDFPCENKNRIDVICQNPCPSQSCPAAERRKPRKSCKARKNRRRKGFSSSCEGQQQPCGSCTQVDCHVTCPNNHCERNITCCIDQTNCCTNVHQSRAPSCRASKRCSKKRSQECQNPCSSSNCPQPCQIQACLVKHSSPPQNPGHCVSCSQQHQREPYSQDHSSQDCGCQKRQSYQTYQKQPYSGQHEYSHPHHEYHDTPSQSQSHNYITPHHDLPRNNYQGKNSHDVYQSQVYREQPKCNPPKYVEHPTPSYGGSTSNHQGNVHLSCQCQEQYVKHPTPSYHAPNNDYQEVRYQQTHQNQYEEQPKYHYSGPSKYEERPSSRYHQEVNYHQTPQNHYENQPKYIPPSPPKYIKHPTPSYCQHEYEEQPKYHHSSPSKYEEQSPVNRYHQEVKYQQTPQIHYENQPKYTPPNYVEHPTPCHCSTNNVHQNVRYQQVPQKQYENEPTYNHPSYPKYNDQPTQEYPLFSRKYHEKEYIPSKQVYAEKPEYTNKKYGEQTAPGYSPSINKYQDTDYKSPKPEVYNEQPKYIHSSSSTYEENPKSSDTYSNSNYQNLLPKGPKQYKSQESKEQPKYHSSNPSKYKEQPTPPYTKPIPEPQDLKYQYEDRHETEYGNENDTQQYDEDSEYSNDSGYQNNYHSKAYQKESNKYY